MAVQEPKAPKDVPKRVKIAVIDGRIISTKELHQTIFYKGELQTRFADFCNVPNREIIDWHVTQQTQSQNWFIFVRYIE